MCLVQVTSISLESAKSLLTARSALIQFSKCLLSAYDVPGTVLGAGDTRANNTGKNLCPRGRYILNGGDSWHVR